jgi:hypothetical protein
VLSKQERRGGEVKNLKASCNNLLHTVLRNIALHMVYYGIINNKNTQISAKHMAGFISSHMPFKCTIPDTMPHINSQKIRILESIIDYTIKTKDQCLDKTKKIKIEKEGQELLGAYMRYLLYTSTLGSIIHYNGKIDNKSWSKILTIAIDTFIETYMCNVKRSDECPVIADSDLDKISIDLITFLNFFRN